jgi:hypothetical protein
MSDFRKPNRCDLYKVGHTPHWIQMSRATQDRENPPSLGSLVESRSEGTVLIEVDELELRPWNHEPERLVEAASAAGGAVEYQPRRGLLWVPSRSGKYAFCVAEHRIDHVPCPLQPAVGSPVQLRESAGGFAISIDALRRQRL